MDIKAIGVLVAVYLVMVDISDAVQVTDAVCNSTYILYKYDHIVLTFMPDGPYDDDGHPFKNCVVTIINNSTSMPLCIKDEGMRSSYFYRRLCSRVFNYYIGYQSQSSLRMKNGYSCSDFEKKPKCTSNSRVYAVFENVLSYAIYPVSVKLYVKERVVSTTTTRPTTTAYWYSNDFEDYDDITGPDYGGIMIKAVIGIAIVVTLFCICGACVRPKNNSGNTGTTNQDERYYQQPLRDIHSPRMPSYTTDSRSQRMSSYNTDTHPSRTSTYITDAPSPRMNTYTTDTPSPRMNTYTTDTPSPRMNTYTTDTPSPRMNTYTTDPPTWRMPRYTTDTPSPRMTTYTTDTPSPRLPRYTTDANSMRVSTYTDEAPSYSEVMQHQRTYSYEVNMTLQIQDPGCGEATASNVATEFLSEDQSLCQDQPETSYTSEQQAAGNQTIPTTPPPDYADLPPPPPYPGY